MINAYCFGNPKRELKSRSSSSTGTSDDEQRTIQIRKQAALERSRKMQGHRSVNDEWGGNEMWPRIEGSLVKRAIKSGMNWKRRYFVLKNGVLTYYKQKNGSIRGQIHVT